jgi:hypothetical protein
MAVAHSIHSEGKIVNLALDTDTGYVIERR